MNKVIAFPNQVRVRQEAAAWLARLDGDALSEQEQAELRDWLNADPRNFESLRQMVQLWGDLDCMAVLAKLFPLQAESANRFAWAWPRTFAFLGVAMSILMLSALFLEDILSHNPVFPNETANRAEPLELVYQTEIGEQSEISLNDGSTLTLNTNSQARVRFNQLERAIFLLEGEAYFEVVKNPDVPFVVYAGNGQVRALGTAFNVRLEGERVEVLVAEGVVQVVANTTVNAQHPTGSSAELNIPQSKIVTLKQSGVAEYSEIIETADYLTEENLGHRLAWHQGKWLFEGETLAEVINEVSRYTDKRIEIIDPLIADLRIGGYFDIGEIEAFMAVLQAGFGVSVNRVGDNLIQLSALDNKNSH